MISVYAVQVHHVSKAVTYGCGHFSGDQLAKIIAASINVKHGTTTRMFCTPHAMDIRRRQAVCLVICAAIATAQPYGELLKLYMQAEPTERFESFCTQWSNAVWTHNVSSTNKIGTLKTCDGLYTKLTADSIPVLVHARPATGPNQPPALFSDLQTAAASSTQATVISVCSQLATSVSPGAPEIGQCPDSHPFTNGVMCCPTDEEITQGTFAACVPCTSQACTESRHCLSGIVDGDLTISTTGLKQWFPTQFSDIVLAAQLYNPSAGFTASNTKVAIVPNLDLGSGTRAFYNAMSDPVRLQRLCFAATPLFGASHAPPQKPPWVLALTFLGDLVPGQTVSRAIGPPVTMVFDGAEVVAPDGHVVITSPTVAFSWILGASAQLRELNATQCAPAAENLREQAALDMLTSQVDAGTLHTWTIFNDTSVRVGLPFASQHACLDVDAETGLPTLADMQMLCDVSAPDCVAVAARPGKACLIVAKQTADGVSLPYVHDANIDHPPEAVFTIYAARNPVTQDVSHMSGVEPLGSDAVATQEKHTTDSCRALCWSDPSCTAWTLEGDACRVLGVEQTQTVVTTDGLNLTCMEKLGFDVGPQSAQCADLPLNYAFSQHQQKCVHLDDYLLQPWCTEPWTTASGSEPVPELSRNGAAFMSYPRTTCVCNDNEHVVGSSSPDGRTGIRCTGTGSAVRHPGSYSNTRYNAFRVFLRTAVTVLETFTCAVPETCPDEAVARCEMVLHCAGAIVDGATHTVEIFAGIADTKASLQNQAGKSAVEIARDSALMNTLPTYHKAPDQILMQPSAVEVVQEGLFCYVEAMHFIMPPLVCVNGVWVKQTVDNVDNVQHGAVVCGGETLNTNADAARFECVDRPLLRTAPTLTDSLLANNVNPSFVGAAPQAHGSDAVALYVSRAEQCVNPDYLLNAGPVVQPGPCMTEVRPDPGCNAQNPFRRGFDTDLDACYSIRVDDLNAENCTTLAQAFNIEAGFSYGIAPPAAQSRWQSIPCVGLLPFPKNPGTACACSCSTCLQDGSLPVCENAEPCTSAKTVRIEGSENWRSIQAQHPSMVREVLQLSGCVETIASVPQFLSAGLMSDLFAYAKNTCDLAQSMHSTATLAEFLNNGGDFTRDIYLRTGCTQKLGVDEVLNTASANDRLTVVFDRTYNLCTSGDPDDKIKCCGSATCTPKRCKHLKGVPPLPQCSVTAHKCTELTQWTKLVASNQVETGKPDSACNTLNLGSGAAPLVSSSLDFAHVPSNRVQDYAVPYPALGVRQIHAAAPGGYSCVPSPGNEPPVFAGNFLDGSVLSTDDKVSAKLLQSAWMAAGCFTNLGAAAKTLPATPLRKILGDMRATCLLAQDGDFAAQTECCGRPGCNAVLDCPLLEPLPLPLPVCPGDTIAYRAGNGYKCRKQQVTAGVQCKHLCALAQNPETCHDNIAIDIDGVGCLLVDKEQCLYVEKWDNPNIFPCAAGLDAQGRACIGQPDNTTKTCQVHVAPTQATSTDQAAPTVAAACPDIVTNPLHTPWAFEQQSGQCASSVFSASADTLHESTQSSWFLCNKQASTMNATEFSYDDVTGLCVVNTDNVPCTTVADVVSAVQEKNHYGSARADGSGTDLRAWIGQDGPLGAQAVFANDVTSPQVDAFVCMPRTKCGTRDVHGRCIATTERALSTCGFVPVTRPAQASACATNCPSETDQFFHFLYSGTTNECNCNDIHGECFYSVDNRNYNNIFNLGPVDPFLDDVRTRCALHTNKASCDADSECLSRPKEIDRKAAIPTIQGTPTSDNCDYGTGTCASVKGNGEANAENYALPELRDDQVRFHSTYYKTQESVLGQDYPSTFYRAWVASPWNRDRFIAAAARKANDEDAERPFYASAIWSGDGGRDWDALMPYDKRWVAGAATVAYEGTGLHDGLDSLQKTDVPNAAAEISDAVYGLPGSGQFKAYSDRNRVTPMWSPMRAWLLGVHDPFLDNAQPQVANVKARANQIDNNFLSRIVAFRGRQPRQDLGAQWLQDVLVDRDNAVNECLQQCDTNQDCRAVSIRSALLVSDTEPLNFVNTGGGLGVQGDTYTRPQTCPTGHQPHLSAFQYNAMRWCPYIARTFMTKLFGLTSNAQLWFVNWWHHIMNSMFTGGLADSVCSGKAMSGQPNCNLGFQDQFWKNIEEQPDAQAETISAPRYGQDWTFGMMGSIGSNCVTQTTGPMALRGQTTSLGDQQCHFRLGLHHCNKCWESQEDPGHILGSASTTPTLQTKQPDKIMCRQWRFAPLTSLGRDTVVKTSEQDEAVDLDDVLVAHDGDSGGAAKALNFFGNPCPSGFTGPKNAYNFPHVCCKGTFDLEKKCTPLGKTAPLSDAQVDQALKDGVMIALGTRGKYTQLDLGVHTSDTPLDAMQMGKARMQRPTPVRFRYTTIYLPQTPIQAQQAQTATTSTRYTRRATAPTHRVHRASTSDKTVQSQQLVKHDNSGANVPITPVIQAAKKVLQTLGVQPDNDQNFWLQRSSVCNNRQQQRPVFTLARCPKTLPLTCALPWPIFAQNVADNTINAASPNDYRVDGTKCTPVVAVCLDARWRYAGIHGTSLCAKASRLLELMLDKETETTPSTNFDLGAPPHVDFGNFTWPVTWLQDDSGVNSSPFRTRRPEPAAGTVFPACSKRKPCNQRPCPDGMGLAWTAAGVPFCTRVGAGSRGFQQMMRDVPKSVHASRRNFAGFTAKADAVSGTGPALYEQAAPCAASGCGGAVTTHCNFEHVADKQFPSCQRPDRVAQACCSADVTLVPTTMTQKEQDLLKPPKALLHAFQPNVTCEAEHGLACGNAEYALRSTHDTGCTCDTDTCRTEIRPQVKSASMQHLDQASVIINQGQRCGKRVRWAPQYLSIGQSATRCNGMDDITKGGSSVNAQGGLVCGCTRTNVTTDAAWQILCNSPHGCAVHGLFTRHDDTAAQCPQDIQVTLNENASTFLQDLFSDSVVNWCAHECLHYGASCWAFDVTESGACTLHVHRSLRAQCVGQLPQFERTLPVYQAHTTGSTASAAENVAPPSPAPDEQACANRCTGTQRCLAWGFDANKVCHLGQTVRRYDFAPIQLEMNITANNRSQIQAANNAKYIEHLQLIGFDTQQPLNATEVFIALQQNPFFFNSSANFSVGGDATAVSTVPDIVNDTRTVMPCTDIIGLLPSTSFLACARACDFGHLRRNCTGFVVNSNFTCTMCANGGGAFQAVEPSKSAQIIPFFAVHTGENHVAFTTFESCAEACDASPSCAHCITVHSAAKQDEPHYVHVGKTRHVSNMPIDGVYPWISLGHTKWDTECCTDAPCAQSHGRRMFDMGMCPGPAHDAHLAGQHSISILDTTSMQCVTKCEPGFANPPACNECASEHFDPASNCTKCLPVFALASDGACSLCKDPKADITTDCQQCLPGFRVSQGGACLEWTCTAQLHFEDTYPSVTETTDVVLKLNSNDRLATGAFVGTPLLKVPASLRSVLLQQGGNTYLLGHDVRYLVEPDVVTKDAVLEVLDDSDWLDGLPISKTVPQPLTRAQLMDPGGVLGNLRCGASGFEMGSIVKDPCSVQVQSTLVCTVNVVGAQSKEKCAQACIDASNCVMYVHQAQEDAVFKPSIQSPSIVNASCQLYDAQQAKASSRPRNMMVNRGTCAGAGVRVVGDGLVSYLRPNDMRVVQALDKSMQFRVVRALDLNGQDAGCWILTRWHRHRVVTETAAIAQAAQRPCTAGTDIVSIAWLDEHAPMQGNDVLGSRLAGFMPRSITTYNLVGGVNASFVIHSPALCVNFCVHNHTSFATKWDGNSNTCTCYDDESTTRVQTFFVSHTNVIITGRRPRGAPTLGRGPVSPNCTVQAQVDHMAPMSMTLAAFVQQGGDLNRDVYMRTGCTGQIAPKNPLASASTWFAPTAPMSKFFVDAYNWCIATDSVRRTKCCGFAACVPKCTQLFAQEALCDRATETNFDGFVLDTVAPQTARCRGLLCTGFASVTRQGTDNAVVQIHKTAVVEPKKHQELAFDEHGLDVPFATSVQLDAAGCCQQCKTHGSKPNSYKFIQATGECMCFDARARVCAPSLIMNTQHGACRYCTTSSSTQAVCRLAALSDCSGVFEAENAPVCSETQAYVSFSGQDVSQQCASHAEQNTVVSSTLGCDRVAGCVMTRRPGNITDYFCTPVSRVNTITAEWHKPPHVVHVDSIANVADLDAMCRAMGYNGGMCSASDVLNNATRIGTCDCGVDNSGQAQSVCASVNCQAPASTTTPIGVWCCEDEAGRTAPCGAAATSSAVVADITTVFHNPADAPPVASVGHSNVCSSSADFAQRFTLVRCAPQQCKSMGQLVQNALFVASTEDNVLRRVQNDTCETCGLCQHPVVYRTLLFMQRAILATGPSIVANSSNCPAHMPYKIPSTNACALTSWGGHPVCCPAGEVCTGKAADAEPCDVRPVLRCADLNDPCEYTRHEAFECKSLASVVLVNIDTEDKCREQCDIQATPPCLLYEYVQGLKKCLLGKANSAGMRACATDANSRESNPFAVLGIKVQPPGEVCHSEALHHYAQNNHVARSNNVVLSAVAREHSALYSLNAVDKINRLYGSFVRQYRSFVPFAFETPYDVLCGIATGVDTPTNCPGTSDSVVGHAVSHPLVSAEDNAVEKLVFDPGVQPLAASDNVALVTSAAVLVQPRQAGSNACIQQAELSVQASSATALVADRHINRTGLDWVEQGAAVQLSTNATQRACLQACLEHVPVCSAFEHGSISPLDVATCVLYIGQLPVPVSTAVHNGTTVYIMNTQQTCTSAEQCVSVANFKTQNALLTQAQTFQQALQRCQQETMSASGHPKLMGRATYINVVRCPPQASKPAPWHVQYFDHDAGVLCWNTLSDAPGVSADGHTTYPFTQQAPIEPDEVQDTAIVDPDVSFAAPVVVETNVTNLVTQFGGCNFVRSPNATVVMQSETTNARGFQDLQNITKCSEQRDEECGTDDVCKLEGANQCTYQCTAEKCANTLLCRGFVHHRATNTRTCLFLPIGTGLGHMQSPSALQPCFVPDMHAMTKAATPDDVYVKMDCCLRLSAEI